MNYMLRSEKTSDLLGLSQLVYLEGHSQGDFSPNL